MVFEFRFAFLTLSINVIPYARENKCKYPGKYVKFSFTNTLAARGVRRVRLHPLGPPRAAEARVLLHGRVAPRLWSCSAASRDLSTLWVGYAG